MMNTILIVNQDNKKIWEGSATQAYKSQIASKLGAGKLLLPGEFARVTVNGKELKGKDLRDLALKLELKVMKLISTEPNL